MPGFFVLIQMAYTMIEMLLVFGDLVEAEEGFAGEELAGRFGGTLFGFL